MINITMSKIDTRENNMTVLSRASRSTEARDQDTKVKTRSRYWIVALSIFLMPAMVQHAEARKSKKPDYCIENGCKGDKCIACQR